MEIWSSPVKKCFLHGYMLTDRLNPQPKYNGLYQIALAMKYLRSTNQAWVDFVTEFKRLISVYDAVIDMERMNFPTDWESHFEI